VLSRPELDDDTISAILTRYAKRCGVETVDGDLSLVYHVINSIEAETILEKVALIKMQLMSCLHKFQTPPHHRKAHL